MRHYLRRATNTPSNPYQQRRQKLTNLCLCSLVFIIYASQQLGIVNVISTTMTTNAGGKGEGLLEMLAPSSSSAMNMSISTRTQMQFDDIGKHCGVLLGNNNNHHHSRHHNTPSETSFVIDTTTAANNNTTQKDWCATTFGRTWGEYLKLNQGNADNKVLKKKFPKECLPRIVLLSSYGTSGNGILRLLFRLNTGFFNDMEYPHNTRPNALVKTSNARLKQIESHRAKRKQKRKRIIDMKDPPNPKSKSADIQCERMNHSSDNNGLTNNKTTIIDPNKYLAIPYTDNDIFIEKCHDVRAREEGGLNTKMLQKQQRQQRQQQQQQPPRPLPSHCIQLMRNPGDHLMRNNMRWKSLRGRGTYRNTNSPNKEEFIHHARGTFCKLENNSGQLIKMTEKWNNHYREAYEYCSVRNRIPRRVVMYEHITDPSIVEQLMEDLLSFVGYDTPVATDGSSGRLQQQQQQHHQQQQRFHHRHHVNYTAVIRVPTYDHGRLLVDACGIEFARMVHNLTKEVAVDFGYQFDFEKGIWIIP